MNRVLIILLALVFALGCSSMVSSNKIKHNKRAGVGIIRHPASTTGGSSLSKEYTFVRRDCPRINGLYRGFFTAGSTSKQNAYMNLKKEGSQIILSKHMKGDDKPVQWILDGKEHTLNGDERYLGFCHRKALHLTSSVEESKGEYFSYSTITPSRKYPGGIVIITSDKVERGHILKINEFKRID